VLAGGEALRRPQNNDWLGSSSFRASFRSHRNRPFAPFPHLSMENQLTAKTRVRTICGQSIDPVGTLYRVETCCFSRAISSADLRTSVTSIHAST
jgi:hypothetical protein